MVAAQERNKEEEEVDSGADWRSKVSDCGLAPWKAAFQALLEVCYLVQGELLKCVEDLSLCEEVVTLRIWIEQTLQGNGRQS